MLKSHQSKFQGPSSKKVDAFSRQRKDQFVMTPLAGIFQIFKLKSKVSGLGSQYSLILQALNLQSIFKYHTIQLMSSSSSFQDLQQEEETYQIMRRTASEQSAYLSSRPTHDNSQLDDHHLPKEKLIVEEKELILKEIVNVSRKLSNEVDLAQKESKLGSENDGLLLDFDDEDESKINHKPLKTDQRDDGDKMLEIEDQENEFIFKNDEKEKSILKVQQSLIKEKLCLLEKQMTLVQEKREQIKETNKKVQEKNPSQRSNFILACQRNTKRKCESDREKENIRKKENQKEILQVQNNFQTNQPETEELLIKNENLPQIKDKEENSCQTPPKRKASFTLACQRFQKEKILQNKLKESKKCDEIEKKEEEVKKKNEEKKEAIEASFDDFFKNCELKEENCKCSSGFKAVSICVEKKCENSSYICSSNECKSCSQLHKNCNLRFTVEMFSKAVNKNLLRQKQTAEQIFNFGSSIIEAVLSNRRKLNSNLCFKGYTMQNKDNLNKIDLKSNEILDLLEAFKTEEEKESYKLDMVKSKLEEDRTSIQQTLNKGISFILNPLKLEQIVNLSSHLSNSSENKFIMRSLNYPSEMRLIYRASENEFNLSKFHQLCDNLENTFTIIKTQHEKLIGGFTPLKWKDRLGRDRSNKSFLLAISLKEKLEHIRNGECAIHYDKDLGPSFGGMFEKRDIQIYQENGLLKCATNFPNTFNWKKQFLPCQESWRFLTGVKDGKKCKVMDFEVFQVQFRK